jgi:diaminohydroxyphosphoribosylaminopyrimidine deaminase/5-amino-6-(5-phosphoribosylamino)uracil reductase
MPDAGFDEAMMARALRLAQRARFWSRPNPHVGCVLVKGGAVVGEGFTQPVGGAHAEVQALVAAGEAARGSTAYVTLEPCAHEGRTPPCADALLLAGVERVVAAVEDPHSLVAGAGFRRLREAGVAVEVGVLAGAVEAQLAGFLARHRRGRGRLRVKLAMSLDGRTAMASGESRWITGPPARRDVQRLRAESCAIVTGVGSVLADDCSLTVRDSELEGMLLPAPQRRAARVVLDSRLRTPPGAAVFDGLQPTLLVHDAAAAVPEELENSARLPLARAAAPGAGLPLEGIMDALAARECNEILLESGPTLAGEVLRAGLADELIVYVAPKLLGSDARPLVTLSLAEMASAIGLEPIDQRRIGNDLRLRFAVPGKPCG